MPQNLRTSEDYMNAANAKMDEIRDYASHRQVFGLLPRPNPVTDETMKAMSDNYQRLYSTGMKLKRQEMAPQNPMVPARFKTPSSKTVPLAEPTQYRKGGRVKKSGLAMVHRGETVLPATQERKPLRMGKRR